MSSTEGEGRIDPAAIDRLYTAHGSAVRAFLKGLLRDEELSAEALQSVFGKAIAKGSEVPPEAMRGWLFRVAYHEAMAIKRRQGIEARLLRKLAWSAPRDVERPDESAARNEARRRVRTAVERLPAAQQEVLRRRVYDEMTFAEIAETLDVPLGTVLTRMRLALKKLHKALAERE